MAIEAADVVVHAGDWTDVALLDLFEKRSRRLVAVYGNNDHGELRERLPEVARAEIEGLRIAVVHETGDKKRREERCAARFPDSDLLVFGHSHIPWDTTAPTGLRLLNPGSPTDRRRQPHGTFVTAVADDGELRDVTFHPLPLRQTPRARTSR
jgi:putative phosphoesterase